MNYSVTGEQLTNLADWIRAKANIAPQGKNLMNPNVLFCKLNQMKKYTISMKVKWNGTATSAFTATLKGSNTVTFVNDRSPAPASGTVTTEVFSTQNASGAYSSVSLALTEGLEISEIQVEEGNEATAYEAYQPTLLEFPNEFISALQSMS